MFVDHQNDLWAFNTGNASGIYYINASGSLIRHIEKNTPGPILMPILFSNIIQDDKNLIWIATDHGGIDILNKTDFKIIYLVNNEDDNKSLAQNSTISIYRDNSCIAT